MVTVHCILVHIFCKMRKRIKKEEKTFWHKAAKLEGGDHKNRGRCPLKNITLFATPNLMHSAMKRITNLQGSH